jgi:hypothetical protein
MKSRSRRRFIKQTAGIAISIPTFIHFAVRSQDIQYPKLVIRVGWDSQDNDDLAHIPALYRLAQKSILQTEFYLWMKDTDSEVMEMLNSNFTNLKVVTGDIDESGEPTSDELKEILSSTDLFIYSTGAAQQVDWTGDSQKGIETRSLEYCLQHSIPYVIMGIGEIPEDNAPMNRFLKIANSAEYVFSTSSSIDKKIKEKKLKIQNLKELPNPLFAFDLRNASQSRTLLGNFNLLNNDFLTIDFRSLGLSREQIVEFSKKISALITSWVQETDKQVLILPNHPADIDPTFKNIYQPLAEKIKSKVFFMEDKLRPDIAASIYEKSRVVSGMSLFPACSAIQSGIPVCFLSSASFDTRARTIEDLGLKNAIQELETHNDASLAEILLEINNHYLDGIIESGKAREFAMKELLEHFADLNKFINKTAEKSEKGKKKNKKENKKN